MRRTLVVAVVLCVATVVMAAPASAADVPDFLGSFLEGVGNRLEATSAVGYARVYGDQKTVDAPLAYVSIGDMFNTEKLDWLDQTVEVSGESYDLSFLELVYDPSILIGENTEWNLGLSLVRVTKGDGFLSLGLGYVDKDVDDNHLAAALSVGAQWAF